jgi:hypothetical protein
MAVSTTQSIWRSGGGDQTRTSYCGSGVMAADFYIADASVATPTNIAVDSTLLTTYLILPAGAVVTSVIITDAGSGSIDLNTLGVNSGTASAAFVANGLSVASTGAITSGLTFATVAELSYLTVTIDTSGAGTVGGYITYFVVDPLFGQQNV